MTLSKLIQSSLNDLKKITKADFSLYNKDLEIIASTSKEFRIDNRYLTAFADSEAESQSITGHVLFRFSGSSDETYILMVHSRGGDVYMSDYTLGKIAVSEIMHLMNLKTTVVDKESFYRDALLGDILSGEISERAGTLKIPVSLSRIVFLIKLQEEYTESAYELISNMYLDSNDFAVIIDKTSLCLIREASGADSSPAEYADNTARQLLDMINMELLIPAKIGYSKVSDSLRSISEYYKQAAMALEIIDTFYTDHYIASYESLGIGRLILQLPDDLCDIFLEEVCGEADNTRITRDDIAFIENFFSNNLNTSEAARAINMKRTTFIYRLDKLKNLIGLDIRNFEDAVTVKIAIMVLQYRKKP